MRKKIYLAIISILVGIIVIKFVTANKPGNSKNEIKTESLNQFYNLVKTDPLFTSPDLDGQAFLEVAKALEIEEKEVQTYLKSTEPLYPIAFLKDVVEVDKQHREFMSNRSVDSAKKLVEAYRRAQQDYKVTIESLNKTLQNGQFPDESLFTGINTSVSFKVIKGDVAKLVENATLLGKEIDSRQHCLETGKECKNTLDSLAEPQIMQENFKFTQKDLLAKDILFSSYRGNEPLFGPYVVYTGCYGFSGDLKPIPYPFYIGDKKTSRVFPTLYNNYFKLGTTNYYKRLIANPDGPGGYLLQSKKEWIGQKETQLYMCNDPSYEANLLAVDNFYRLYKQSPLFNQPNIDSLPEEVKQAIQKGGNIEKLFFESEFPSEINAANTANYYAYFYSLLGEWDKKYSGQPWLIEVEKNKEEYLTRGLVYNRKLSNIHVLMTNALQNINQLRIRFTLAKQNPGAFAYMYGFRTFYGLYYLTFSPSFNRLSEPLAYLSTQKITIPVESRGAHITYQEALKMFTPAEIAGWKFAKNELLKEEIEEYNKLHPDTPL